MEQVLIEYVRKMDIKNFSNSTKKSYHGELKKYLKYCKEHDCENNCTTYEQYLAHLITIKKLSECSLKQSIGAVKFFLSTAWTFRMN